MDGSKPHVQGLWNGLQHERKQLNLLLIFFYFLIFFNHYSSQRGWFGGDSMSIVGDCECRWNIWDFIFCKKYSQNIAFVAAEWPGTTGNFGVRSSLSEASQSFQLFTSTRLLPASLVLLLPAPSFWLALFSAAASPACWHHSGAALSASYQYGVIQPSIRPSNPTFSFECSGGL